MFTHYRDQGATLAADLVNSLGRSSGREYLPDAKALRDFLEEHGLVGEKPTEADLAAVRRLRKRISGAFEAEAQADRVDILNSLLRKYKARPVMSGHDGDWHWHFVDVDAPLVDRLAVLAAMGLASLLAELGPERLGTCHADDCAAVFVDISKNKSRRYCDETCSTRMNVAAYRARKGSNKEKAAT